MAVSNVALGSIRQNVPLVFAFVLGLAFKPATEGAA